MIIFKIFIVFYLSYGFSLESIKDKQVEKIVNSLVKKKNKKNKVIKVQVKEKNITLDVKYSKKICLRHHYKINKKGKLHVLETLTSCM